MLQNDWLLFLFLDIIGFAETHSYLQLSYQITDRLLMAVNNAVFLSHWWFFKNSMMGLLICKYNPSWQEIIVESLLLRWLLRPMGFDFSHESSKTRLGKCLEVFPYSISFSKPYIEVLVCFIHVLFKVIFSLKPFMQHCNTLSWFLKPRMGLLYLYMFSWVLNCTPWFTKYFLVLL